MVMYHAKSKEDVGMGVRRDHKLKGRLGAESNKGRKNAEIYQSLHRFLDDAKREAIFWSKKSRRKVYKNKMALDVVYIRPCWTMAKLYER